MVWKTVQTPRGLWSLAAEQHGVVTRTQLLALGFSRRAIEHRLARGRLHRVHRGVYSVGRPELTRYGRWMAAVLSCGPGAALSHCTAAALWGIRGDDGGPIHVTVPAGRRGRERPGIVVHRRSGLDAVRCRGIPVTSPVSTLIDIAAALPAELGRAINEADKLNLVDPEGLRRALDEAGPITGVRRLRTLLDRLTFVLTDSELEDLFVPIARRAGLPRPETRSWVNGFKVDFHWSALGLVVETDGLRFHRTAVQQARDRLRDQTHTAAGLTCLRFTHAQVKFEPRHVESVLRAVARRLAT